MVWGIFRLFDVAWVYQAIESHAVCMVFHPSTDLGKDNIYRNWMLLPVD